MESPPDFISYNGGIGRWAFDLGFRSSNHRGLQDSLNGGHLGTPTSKVNHLRELPKRYVISLIIRLLNRIISKIIVELNRII